MNIDYAAFDNHAFALCGGVLSAVYGEGTASYFHGGATPFVLPIRPVACCAGDCYGSFPIGGGAFCRYRQIVAASFAKNYRIRRSSRTVGVYVHTATHVAYYFATQNFHIARHGRIGCGGLNPYGKTLYYKFTVQRIGVVPVLLPVVGQSRVGDVEGAVTEKRASQHKYGVGVAFAVSPRAIGVNFANNVRLLRLARFAKGKATAVHVHRRSS